LIIFRNNVKYLNIFYIFKIFIEKFGTKRPVCLILLYQSAEKGITPSAAEFFEGGISGQKTGLIRAFIQNIPFIYCGVMKLLADMPSRLGGGDHRTNAA